MKNKDHVAHKISPNLVKWGNLYLYQSIWVKISDIWQKVTFLHKCTSIPNFFFSFYSQSGWCHTQIIPLYLSFKMVIGQHSLVAWQHSPSKQVISGTFWLKDTVPYCAFSSIWYTISELLCSSKCNIVAFALPFPRHCKMNWRNLKVPSRKQHNNLIRLCANSLKGKWN